MQFTEEDAKTQRNIEILQRIAELRRASKRTIGLSPTQMRERSQQAIIDWINGWDANWDVACCWHVSAYQRHTQAALGERLIQRQLSVYFNRLRKRIYAHMPLRLQPNLARFITLEQTDGVGWHAHGILATPNHMSIREFQVVLRELWIEQAGCSCLPQFRDRLFWCDELGSGYQSYMLKSAINLHSDQFRELKGLIDLDNTYRP